MKDSHKLMEPAARHRDPRTSNQVLQPAVRKPEALSHKEQSQRKKKHRQSASKVKQAGLLVSAVVVLFLGVTSAVVKAVTDRDTDIRTTIKNENSAGSNATTYLSANMMTRSGQNSLLNNMSLDKAQFLPVSSLKLPADGKPITVYCLFRAGLDSYTQERWMFADMLKESVSFGPLLRTVTIKSQDALDNLYDWRVEGVATRLIPQGKDKS